MDNKVISLHGLTMKIRGAWCVWRKMHFVLCRLHWHFANLKKKKWLYRSVQCLSPISETTLLCADALWRLPFLRPIRLVLTWRWVWRIGEMIVTGGTEVPRENPVLILLCASKISHRLVGNPTQASALRGQRLTAWDVARTSETGKRGGGV